MTSGLRNARSRIAVLAAMLAIAFLPARSQVTTADIVGLVTYPSA
jgi:hypothetical protein